MEYLQSFRSSFPTNLDSWKCTKLPFPLYYFSLFEHWCRPRVVDREMTEPQKFPIVVRDKCSPLSFFCSGCLLCPKYLYFSSLITVHFLSKLATRAETVIRIKLRIQHFGNTFKQLITELMIFLSADPQFSSFLHYWHGKRRKEGISLENLGTSEQNQMGWHSLLTKKDKIKRYNC